MSYFSDIEEGPRPRVSEVISDRVWGGLIALIESRVQDESFGGGFPTECEDGQGVSGCNVTNFYRSLEAEVPGIEWPLRQDPLPDTLTILDTIQFCHRAVGRPIWGTPHEYFNHRHRSYDLEAGKAEFREKVNLIFARNRIAFELGEDGLIRRLAPEGLRQALMQSVFQTGDQELDRLLEDARSKFLNPDLNVRKEALEKIWDGWERLKTIENPTDKSASTGILLDKVTTEPEFRRRLKNEARELTEIGNAFMIRHTEVGKTPIESAEQVDYLFTRLFALVRLLLRCSGRGG